MKKTSFIFTLLTPFTVLGDNTQLLLNKAVNDMRGHSDQIIMLIGEELKHNVSNPSEFNSSIDNFQEQEILIDSSYRSMQRVSNFETTYNRVQQKYDSLSIQHSGMDFTAGMIKGMVKAGSAAIGASVSMGVGTAVGLSLAETINESVVDTAVEYMKGEVSKNTAAVVTNLLKEELGKEKEYLLQDLSPENIAQVDEIFAVQEKLESLTICPDCSEEQNEMMRKMAQENLSNIVKGNTGAIDAIKDNLDITNSEVQNNIKRINSISEQFKTYQTITNESITDLQDSQSKINKELGKLHGKISSNSGNIVKNAKDIKFLKDFMYGKMSPRQRMLALNSGQYGQNFTEEKKKLIRLHGKFEKNVGDLLNGANQVMGIASDLGINMPKEFSEAISKGNKAYGAINGALTHYASGNYLGAVASLTGMMGKKRDIGAERHAQIMKALGAIMQNQKIMLANQKKILENQEKIYAKLVEIENLIIKTSQRLYDEIYLARVDIRYNREALLELVSTPYKNCNRFVNGTKDRLRNTRTNQTAYEKRQSFFKRSANRATFSKCIELATQLQSPRLEGMYSSQFKLGLNKNENSISNSKYIQSFYLPIYNFFVDHISDKSHNLFLATNPMNHSIALKSAYLHSKTLNVKDFFSSDDWENSNYGEINILELLKEPLFFDSIIKVSSLVNDFYFYLDLVEDGKMIDLDELIETEGEGIFSPGYEILRGIKTHLNMSLVQASLLSGQLIIPYIYDNIQNTDLFKSFNSKVLKNSNLIKENFIRYFVYNKIQEYTSTLRFSEDERTRFNSGFLSLITYDRFLTKRNAKKLNEIIGASEETNYKVLCKKDEPCVLKIDEFTIALKPSSEYESGEFIQHPMVKKLLTLSKLTSMNMMTYTMHDDIEHEDETDAKNFRLLLLKSARAIPKR